MPAAAREPLGPVGEEEGAEIDEIVRFDEIVDVIFSPDKGVEARQSGLGAVDGKAAVEFPISLNPEGDLVIVQVGAGVHVDVER